MRRQHICSKCGLACTWRSDSTSSPVTCKACQRWEKKGVGYHPQHHGTTSTQPLGIAFPLPQRVSTALHIGIREQNQLQSSIDPSLELSLSQPQGDQVAYAEKSSSSWNPRGIQKRRRSKLAQPTVFSLEKFANQLLQTEICDEINGISANQSHSLLHENPKYDDDFIYEKCNFISHNEIGTGAVLLSPFVASTNCREAEFVQVKVEPYTGDDYASSCLFEVPIRGLSE